MDERNPGTGDKWSLFRERYTASWETAKTQESSLGKDLPVDHFFPTQLPVIKGKYELGLAGVTRDELIFTKEEARRALTEILEFLVKQPVDNEQLKRVEAIWKTDPGLDSRKMGGQELAKLLGSDEEPWDPFIGKDNFSKLRDIHG